MSGTSTASSTSRRSRASLLTALPSRSWSTAEISRSMYIAASTIAIAPTTAQPHPVSKTPVRIRNSPAKAVDPGTASAMMPVDHQYRGQRRPTTGHASQPVEAACARSPFDEAGEHEQRRRQQAVVHHLQEGAVPAGDVRREEAEGDQPELREARVRDHAADVRRTEGEQRAVDETDRGQRQDRHPQVGCRAGEQDDGDVEEAVRGGLRDDAGKHARHLRRRLAIGGREPAVEREDRCLDGERHHEAEEQPCRAACGSQLRDVERPLREAEHDDRGQHQQRARHRVDHEEQGRPLPALSSPDARRGGRAGSASPPRRRRRAADPGRRRRRRWRR